MVTNIPDPRDPLWQRPTSDEDVIKPASEAASDIIKAGVMNLQSMADQREVNWEYYDGTKEVATLGIAVPPELRLIQVSIDWPSVVVDGLEERLDVTGFRTSDEKLTRELWDIWNYNEMEQQGQLHRVEFLATGSAYTCVGTNEEDPSRPLITVDDNVFAYRNPRNRKIEWAVRVVETENGEPSYVMLYLPDSTQPYGKTSRGWVTDGEADQHNLGEVLVTPAFNRGRQRDILGRSEMDKIKSISDDCTRTLTEMALAREFHSVPQRYLLGAEEDDFIDPQTKKPMPKWKAYIGYYLTLGNPEATAGQFQASDLRNFHDTINMYAKLASSATGFPIGYFGFSTDNPASAEAITASDNRLVKHAERKQTPLSGAYKRTMQQAWRLANDGADLPEELRDLVVVWADPSTPTLASKADATTKLFGAQIIDQEMAWDMLNFTEDQKDAMRGRVGIRRDLGNMLGGNANGEDSGGEAANPVSPEGNGTATSEDGTGVSEDAAA